MSRFRKVARTAVQRGTDVALRAVDAPPSLDTIQRYLDAGRAAEGDRTAGGALVQPPRASLQSWNETLYTVIADGGTVSGTASETIMVPDFTLPAGYLYPGRTLHYILWGRLSTAVTTPGTTTMALRWGGVAGTVMTTSGAYAPETGTVATNLAFWVEYYSVCRSVGTSGTSFTMGRMSLSDYDSTSAATLRGNLGMNQFGDVPVVATVDTTTAKAISPTYKSSLTTASCTTHIAILSALT